MLVLERPRQVPVATSPGNHITAASVAAAQVVLNNMTAAEHAALQDKLHARWLRDQTHRHDFALRLQIKANPLDWL